MLMLIQLDHILKQMKNKIIVFVLVIVSFSFSSCVEKNFKVLTTQEELSYVKTYSLSLENIESEYSRKDFTLTRSYPKLKIEIKLTDDTIDILKVELTNPDQSLKWEVDSTLFYLADNQDLVIDNINLASTFFQSGLYNIKLLSEDGRELNHEISIKNKINGLKDFFIYLENNYLIFSNNEIVSFENAKELTESLNKTNFEIFFFDKNKEFLDSKFYNYLDEDRDVPSKLKIDNEASVYFIEIKLIDKDGLLNIIKIDLSSSDSLL